MTQQHGDDQNQRPTERTRAQRLDRMFNRILVILGLGVCAIAAYQYVIQPLLS